MKPRSDFFFTNYMPFEHPLAAEGNPDALRNVESFHSPPGRIAANVHAQLTNPQDIASANQFFKPTGGEQFLPTVGKVSPAGIEMNAVAPTAKFGAPPMTGLETQGIPLPTGGGEMAALSAAPGAIPGAEQISPLINMIMKMPGHIGLVSSFFEALGSFFAPAQEMLGHLVEGFDPGALFEHAGSASEALGGVLESAGEHMSVDLNLLPADAPIFDQIGHGTAAGDFASGGLGTVGHSLGANAPDLKDSFAGAPRLEVGGSPTHPIFEMGPDAKTLGFDAPNHNYLAMEPNRGFGATVGNFSPPAATPSAPITQPTVAHNAAPTAAHTVAPTGGAGHGHGSSALDFRKDALSTSREHLLGSSHSVAHSDTAHGAAHSSATNDGANHAFDAQPADTNHGDNQAFDAQPAVANQPEIQTHDQPATPQGDHQAEMQSDTKAGGDSYTVHKGDNLWDIARNHLGDGSRWEEIYDLNKSVLGDNPRMIMPGTELQMPGGDTIASGAGGADYTVQSGDSLWNISHEHMSGGQNWHELYQNNEAVIGSNPAMIHPGQHLHLDASAHDQSLASGGDGAGSAGGHAGVNHDIASAPNHSHHLASNSHHLASNSHHLASNSHHLASHTHGPVHNHSAGQSNVAQHATTDHTVAQAGQGHAAGPANHSPLASQHPAAAVGELNAHAQSLSSIQSYGDGAQSIDTATHVPNPQP
jgi:LysM repeat protein